MTTPEDIAAALKACGTANLHGWVLAARGDEIRIALQRALGWLTDRHDEEATVARRLIVSYATERGWVVDGWALVDRGAR